MKAKVQYNDYCGTTAADRSDWLNDNRGHITECIVEKFEIPINAEKYQFLGISVWGANVEKVGSVFYFKEINTKNIVKHTRFDIKLQSILDLFKRFEFQVGEHLEGIDDDNVNEI